LPWTWTTLVDGSRGRGARATSFAPLLFGAAGALLLANFVLFRVPCAALGSCTGMARATAMRTSSSSTRLHSTAFRHNYLLSCWVRFPMGLLLETEKCAETSSSRRCSRGAPDHLSIFPGCFCDTWRDEAESRPSPGLVAVEHRMQLGPVWHPAPGLRAAGLRCCKWPFTGQKEPRD
jgi:hypothetical protein